jgi:hypothetical protein
MRIKTNESLVTFGKKEIPEGTELNVRVLENNWVEVIEGPFSGVFILDGYFSVVDVESPAQLEEQQT